MYTIKQRDILDKVRKLKISEEKFMEEFSKGELG